MTQQACNKSSLQNRVMKLAYETVAIPEPKADEVLVKVHAFGINRPDILQRQGLYQCLRSDSGTGSGSCR